ncbi:MAG: hypothetical protein WBW74_04845, partial [Xanthobacteraceae bacterium]
MLTPRTLTIVAAAAGALAGLPLSTAQACDNDRFPCPIVVDSSTQDSADVPSRAAPAAQSHKKTTSAPRQTDKAAAKNEQEASRASTHTKASKPAAHEQADARAKASKPAAQEQADPSARTTAEVAPAWP